MNPFKFSQGKPAGVDFEALKAASNFDRQKVTRLRELKSDQAETELFLPPTSNQLEQALTQTEALSELTSLESKQASVEKRPESRADLQALARKAKMQKSALRCEKLKDLQYSLASRQEAVDTVESLTALKQNLLNLQARLSFAYTGKLAISEQEGMSLVRPFLQRQSQKIECLRLNKAEMLPAVYQAEAKILNRLTASNPLPPMERSALMALAESISKGLNLLFAEPETPAQTISASTDTPEWPEVLEPEQIESLLFALRSRLQRSPEEDKERIQAEIEQLQSLLHAHQAEDRLGLLNRLQRSLDQQREQLKEIQTALTQVPHESHCRQLHRDALMLKNRSLSELKRICQDFSSTYPLAHAHLGYEKRLGYFQVTQEVPALSKRDRESFQLDANFQAGKAEIQALKSLLSMLFELGESYLALKTQIQTALRRTRAQTRREALTELESDWENAEASRLAQIDAYWQADESEAPLLQSQLLQNQLNRLTEIQKLRRSIPAMA
jgi:hypothetical protein